MIPKLPNKTNNNNKTSNTNNTNKTNKISTTSNNQTDSTAKTSNNPNKPPMERICETLLSANLLDIFKEKEWIILNNLLDVAFSNEGQQEETKAEDQQKTIEKGKKETAKYYTQ